MLGSTAYALELTVASSELVVDSICTLDDLYQLF